VAPRQIPDDERFTCIRSNPPFRLARSEQQSLISGWLNRLTPDGTAFLVIKQNYGVDRLNDWLTLGTGLTDSLPDADTA
jgi:16S rRNA G1207 methylase RsmC